MSKSFKTQIADLDMLIEAFNKLAIEYPNGHYEKSLQSLKEQRAEIANTIGKQSHGEIL